MTEFFVGQKVVCAPCGKRCDGIRLLARREVGDKCVKGNVYEIRWVGSFTFGVGGDLIEMPACRIAGVRRNTQHPTNLSDIQLDVPFAQASFRPLESKAISLFRKIAADATRKRKITVCEPDRLRQSSREVG